MKRFFLLLLTFVGLAGCSQPAQYTKLSGYTMGTSYNITFESADTDIEQLKTLIRDELELINQLMSTYIDDSEINRFNRLTSGSCFKFSAPTWQVLMAAQEVYQQTEGAFDITVGPLIERWGFDVKEYDDKVPSAAEVAELKATVGAQLLDYNLEQQCISKQNPRVTINLSAIAKGYAVDRLAELMAELGIDNYLVEIGGETKGSGVNIHGYPWRIAVEKPTGLERQELLVIGLHDTSIATSGDYRNYFEVDGQRFSHTIDPTTGFPVTHNLTSVSVVHPSNMYADAYATAFSVMGFAKARAFADSHRIPVFIVTREGDTLASFSNERFDELVID